jgi:CubicO group peptidase (beta-lactamase class C family)
MIASDEEVRMSLAERLRREVEELTTGDGLDGVVLVEVDGTTVAERASGWASRTWRVPSRVDLRYDTASITKLFTTAVVLQQIDAGRLSFDTRVVTYLGLTDTTISPDVTVLHLLTHTSGIGDDADEEAGEEYADLWRTIPNTTIRETVDLLPQFVHKPPVFAPGEGCRYNNVAFVLLGLCVEQATGERYRDVVRRDVFARAGMDRSEFFSMDVVAEDVAEGADPILDADGRVTGWQRNIYSYPPIGSPDGGAHCTARDLVRFMAAARTGQLFSAASTERFLHPHAHHSTTTERIVQYGLCLKHVSDPDGRPRYVEKEGHNPGTSGMVRWYPAEAVTFAVLSNTSEGAWEPARRLDEVVRPR